MIVSRPLSCTENSFWLAVINIFMYLLFYCIEYQMNSISWEGTRLNVRSMQYSIFKMTRIFYSTVMNLFMWLPVARLNYMAVVFCIP